MLVNDNYTANKIHIKFDTILYHMKTGFQAILQNDRIINKNVLLKINVQLTNYWSCRSIF